MVVLGIAAAACLALAWRWRASSVNAEERLEEATSRTTAALGRAPRTLVEGIEDLADERQAALVNNAFIRRAVERLPDGVLVLGPDLEVLFSTAPVQWLLEGRHGEAAVGARLRRQAAEVMAAGSPSETTVEVYEPERRMLRISVEPLPRDVGAGVLALVVDITDPARIDASRSDVVANVSHELKTPVGALAVLVEALGDTDDEAVRERLIARIGQETDRVSALIGDILDLSLVEGAYTALAPVDLAEVVAEAVKRLDVVAHDAGIPVHVEGDDHPVVAAADRSQLMSAVVNLVDNAIKYTAVGGPGGEVRVRARTDGGEAVVEVEDTGVGIAPDHQSRIFERFYRVDRARRRSGGGTGLGLAIVRHVALNHGGSVEVESAPGVGSTFRIRIPLTATD